MIYMIQSATSPLTSESVSKSNGVIIDGAAIQCVVSGTGAVTATVSIDVSNDGKNWILDAATISLSGTTSDSDGFAMTAPWGYSRARLTAISGTNATCDVMLNGRV